MVDGAPHDAGLASALMIYSDARHLGFSQAHFDVRKANTSVWRFHERFGVKRTRERELDYFYVLVNSEMQALPQRYRKYLPQGIRVQGLHVQTPA